ncbi:MAG TPA: succinate dehydrogenase/fumarate reductase iron-sulfur subunit [Aquihabitans sp.]|jgi:succinate dehydrogenase / fumarate reductase iron-sulfur subunit|nr:succinate dehydrogenase/fumarate reductase iron-sulfur subunit [Aquihabitans sp.]
MAKELNVTLEIWRQEGPDAPGHFDTIEAHGISDEMSFLEMLDLVNERLVNEGREAIVFDHDCREGICGTCSLMIDGQAHGPQRTTATCQLHMRKFADGDTIVVEPWRATAFPVIKDLMVDRGALDRIVEAGGFITAETGGAPDANLIPIPKPVADAAMDAAACIQCGACVAACPNSAANLFTAAKVSHLNLLPQGQAERYSRVESMVDTMEDFFGSCTNHGECQEACPKAISIDFIALMNRDYWKAKFKNRRNLSRT